jgi:nucleolar protein TMA23
MDAHALLTAQGWRGSGHSLHPTSDRNGLSRRLLVSKKQNTLGVGRKQHRTSDMWWMNAFDKSLKGLDTSEEGRVVQTVTNGGLDMVARGRSRSGLYASFVQGESLSGTITPDSTEIENPPPPAKADIGKTKEERRSQKRAKATAPVGESPVLESPQVVLADKVGEGRVDNVETGTETKEQRRMRRKRKILLRSREENICGRKVTG